MGGDFWAGDFYRRTRDFQREERNTILGPITQAQVPPSQKSTESRPTRFDRILDTDEVPSVSSNSSIPLLGSTRFDRILRDDED